MLTALCAVVRECILSPMGLAYLGHTTVTENGRTCQAWASQSPHDHTYSADDMFPDGSVNNANNYCRNPFDDHTSLWCYTTDSAVRWEDCDVPICGQ